MLFSVLFHWYYPGTERMLHCKFNLRFSVFGGKTFERYWLQFLIMNNNIIK